MLVLLLSLSLSLAGAQQSVGGTCADAAAMNETCWRYPEELLPLAPSDTTGDPSEDRVLTRLLCHLYCLDRTEDQGECQNNCSHFEQNVSNVNRTISQPVSEPYLMEWNQDGVYIITIPNGTEEEMTSSGSDSVLIGSGETGSERESTAGSGSGHEEVYLIRVSRHGNHSYFPLTSRQGELDLSQFSCSELNISYAVVETEGALSGYSPPLTTCVFIPQEDAPAAQNLTVDLGEITGVPLYYHQARVLLSWDSPSNRHLWGYELIVTLVPIDNDDDICTQKVPFVYSIEKGRRNFTIEPTGSNLTSVLFLCTYNFELKSLPGNDSVSQEKKIVYGKEERRAISPKCGGTYVPSTVSYNLSISWTIDDPLVLEAISSFSLSIVPTSFTLNTNGLKQNARRSYEKGQTDFVHYFNTPVVNNHVPLRMEVKPSRPGRRDNFFWRKSIIPNARDCDVTISAHRPDTISSDDVRLEMKFLSSTSVLSFSLSWAPPTFLNGALERYKVCIGEGGVTGSETCSHPSDCLYLHASETDSAKNLVGCTLLGVVSSPDRPTTEIGYHVVAGTELLFLQIRAVNGFTLLGDWSDPLLILNSTSDPVTPEGPRKTSSSNQVWIYVVTSMLCLVGVALVAVVVLCIYKHFCFHRRIKYEDTMAMERIHRDYFPPSYIPVADEWEVPSEDVEIFYSEELGHGAFGRVYRGLLHSRELREMVNGERRSFRKRGSLGRRRSSRRKASEGVGSRLVAIKRLRDNIDGPDKANFLKEIDMMKKVSGSHHDHQRFVVNMLGCVTIQEPMMLVLEYAKYGDLLTYLRNSREEEEGGAVDPKAAPYLEPVGAYSKLSPRERGQEEEEEGEEEDRKLTEKDLLSFARQIAAGMEFLASLSVVHRDLACRNILVCDNSLVKISDFGLSRSLINQEAYVTTTKGVLPIRWMAPEALFYRTFDTQSDVWSYGILLWELYTLGGYPYPTMSNRDIIDLLTAGYRMDKPELCSDQVYNVMLQCWNDLGLERPTFQDIYVVFDNMLSEMTRQQSPYIQVLGTCYYDKLGPRAQVDSETLDLDNAPANVDIRPPTNGAMSEGQFGTSLPTENGNGFLSLAAQEGGGGGGSNSLQRGGSNSVQRRDNGATAGDGRSQRLGVPLHLPRPQSWVGTSTAELGPRYVPAPLHYASPHSSTSNLTQETVFGSSVVTLSPERQRQLSALQSRSVGSLPLLTNPSSGGSLHSHTNTTRL